MRLWQTVRMSTPPRRFRWRPILIAGAALIVLIVAAWVALIVLLPPARVLAIARQQLSATLKREVRLEGASVSIWPPVRVALHRIAIAEPQGFQHGAALSAFAIDLDLDPFALLARRVVIRSLTIESPTARVQMNADGTTSLDDLVAPGPPSHAPSAAFELAIHRLTIDGGRVLLDDMRTRRRTAFHVESRTSLALDSRSRIETSGHSTFSGLERGTFDQLLHGGLDRSLSDISLTVDHQGKFDPVEKRLALERLDLGFGAAHLLFSGVVDDPGPHARLRLTAKGENVQFGELLHALSAAELPALNGVSGSGRMDFALKIEGTLGPGRMPDVTGVLGIRDAAFRYPGAPASVSALSLDARFAPDSLAVSDAHARVADQPVSGTLLVTHFADPAVRFRVAGSFDLAAVSPLVAPKGTTLGGRATVDVSGTGRARAPDAMALAGRAELSGVRVASPQLPKPMESVSGAIEFSGDRATVRSLSGRSGQSSFTLDATVERPLAIGAKPDSIPPANVDFSLASPNLDLGELLPPTPGPTLLPNARGAGRVSIAHLKQKQLDVRNVNAHVTFDPHNLEVPDFALDGYGGRVSGNAKFDLHHPASPGFAVKATVDSVQADALLSAWTPAKNLLNGALSTTLDLSGAGSAPQQVLRTLTAVGLANLTQGELGPTPALQAIAKLTGVPSFEKLSFREMKLPFEVRNGQIAMKDLNIHSSGSDWKAVGLMGFDGKLDYTVSTLVPADQVARLGADAARAAGALADPQGRLHMSFRVTGNAKNPRVELDANALRADLAGKLQNALGDQGKRIEQQLHQALNQTDSTGKPVEFNAQAAAESLKKIKGKDLFRQLFGPKKSAAPAPTAPPPTAARVDTAHAAADSVKR